MSYFYPPGSRSGSSNLIESGSGCETANLIEFRCNPDPKHYLFKYVFIESGSDPAFFVKKASMRNFRSSRRRLQPSMEKVQLLIWNFYIFYLFCVCLPSWISIWKLGLETGSPLYLDDAILIQKIGQNGISQGPLLFNNYMLWPLAGPASQPTLPPWLPPPHLKERKGYPGPIVSTL